VLALLFMAVLVISNQVYAPKAPQRAAQQEQQVRPPESGDQFTLSSKLTIALKHLMGMSERDAKEGLQALDRLAVEPPERVRLAIVARELLGVDEALTRLEEIKPPPGGVLEQDIQTLRAAYSAEGRVTDPAAEQGLIERHGWFGRLAGLHDVPRTDPRHQALFSFFGPLMAALGLLVLVLSIAVIGGLVASISMLVAITTGRVRPAFQPPSPGGSVYLETFPFFVGGYLCLHFGFDIYATLTGNTGQGVIIAQLGLQWLLMLLPLYGVVVRRVPFDQWRRDVGLHAGAGFWREVWAGVWGYFAALPLLALAIGITFVIVVVRAIFERLLSPGGDPGLPYNPIAELINNGSPGVIAMLFILATVWAPLVEETIFRGCLFRHLRSRFNLFAAAAISALFFGFMHGYNVLLLLPVITIGFTFALMREWRGSLIAPMTAHCMHNATALTVVLTLLNALKE
jgi:membrane protease YdiL (CAAX protease family)